MDNNILKDNKKMQEIIKIIEENPAILEKLDEDKLKIIDNYYIEKIKECKKKLNINI